MANSSVQTAASVRNITSSTAGVRRKPWRCSAMTAGVRMNINRTAITSGMITACAQMSAAASTTTAISAAYWSRCGSETSVAIAPLLSVLGSQRGKPPSQKATLVPNVRVQPCSSAGAPDMLPKTRPPSSDPGLPMRTIDLPRWIFSLFAALVCCGAALAQAPAKSSLKPEGLKQLDTLLAEAVSNKHAAGAVALIARDGKAVYLKGVGMQDAEANKVMQPDALFRIASMTKPITSVAAMVLVDDGKLKLEDPITKYIPEFKDLQVLVPGKDKEEAKFVPAERPITVHHLLTHTSGIPYRFLAPEPLRERYVKAGVIDGLIPTEGTIADNVKRLAALPLAHQPGAAWTYGLNTDVLGRVIEVASGKSLDEFMRERLFEPLKMKDTSFYPPTDKLPRLAAAY